MEHGILIPKQTPSQVFRPVQMEKVSWHYRENRSAEVIFLDLSCEKRFPASRDKEQQRFVFGTKEVNHKQKRFPRLAGKVCSYGEEFKRDLG